ncbi:MAG: ATP-grasp domain-containing protein [Myxococcales bacterium]|nr:MAG: ATP-grasp domain-containing protein [Myxococcales bacterium]
MKKLRVLALVHEGLVPPDDLTGYTEEQINECKTEFDVCSTLAHLGHDVYKLGARDELRPIRQALEAWKPDIVFNLLEEFKGEAVYDQNVVAFLELAGMPYTGCNPRGLMLARDKAVSKQLTTYHRIRAPRFAVYPIGRKVHKPKRLQYPLIVKSLMEDSSMGISQASVVNDDVQLAERVKFVHERVHTDAIAEQFIVGREIYVGVLGNARLTALPPQELVVKNKPHDAPFIATENMKFNVAYQVKMGVSVKEAKKLSEGVIEDLKSRSKRIYKILGLSGYGRIDFRLSEDGRPYFLEANPNPEIARFEEFASAAESAGISYEKLLQKILSLGLQRSA